MTIRIYSKPGCGKCTAAKEKLAIMGYTYEEHDLAYHTQPHEGWREDDSVDIMAAHSQLDTLPLIQVGADFHDYPSAMRALKKRRQEPEMTTPKARRHAMATSRTVASPA